MTIRDWCSSTTNVSYAGATVIIIYQTGKPPIRSVAGNIPADVAKCNVGWIYVSKINPDTLTFLEVEVVIND